jgi:nucleotide-binding universal stress UspA family protein
MRNVLIPVDGSRRSEIAVECIMGQARLGQVGDIHLLNVQPQLGGYIARFVGRRERDAFRREQGQAALAGACRLLDQAGMAYHVHIRIGEAVETTAKTAEELDVDEIVVGADGFGALGAFELHSFVNQLIRRASMPVSVVKNPAAEIAIHDGARSWWPRPTS